jgi:hypothetical protein
MSLIMKSTRRGKSVVGILLALSLAVPAWATEIYKWVDENGVTHFSQLQPDSTVVDVSQPVLQDTRPSDYDPDRDLYDVEGQAERMQQLREERAEKRQARLDRQREAENRKALQYPVREYHYGYPIYRPGWGNPRPPLRPTPPVARPPGPLLPLPPVARPPSLSSGS